MYFPRVLILLWVSAEHGLVSFFFFREYLKDNWFWDGCLEAAWAEGIREGSGEDQR